VRSKKSGQFQKLEYSLVSCFFVPLSQTRLWLAAGRLAARRHTRDVGEDTSANLRVFIGWRGSIAELIHELRLYTNPNPVVPSITY
jgi:hypothetical protein